MRGVAITIACSLATIGAQQKPPAPAASFARQWNHTIDAPGRVGISASPQRLFIAGEKSGVEARSVVDGSVAWQADLPSDLPVAVAGNLLYVASAGQIHALDEASGRERWARPLGAQAVALAGHASGVLTAAGSTVRAWSADGFSLWESELGANVARELLAIDDTQIYVGLTDHRLVALDLSSGVRKWTERLGTLPLGFTVAGGRLLFGGDDRKLHVYTRGGGLKWRFSRQHVIGAPAADDEHVYATLQDNTVVAFGAGNGHLQWRRTLEDRPARGPMLSGSDVVAILRSDVVTVMPRAADKPGTVAPSGAPAPPVTPDSSRSLVLTATPSVDGTRVFAVVELENRVRIAVAYGRSS